MKYQIIVERTNDNVYIAHCSSIPGIRAESGSFGSVIEVLGRELLCYLHDPQAEVEIVVKGGVPANVCRLDESVYDRGTEVIQ